MLKSFFTSAAGMIPKIRELEISANNLANVNTHGFKKQNVFQRYLHEASLGVKEIVNGADASLADGEIYTDFSQGTVEETGNKLDFCILGPGFFVVKKNDQEVLTRNGHFQLDPSGRLVDSNGNPVLTSGGELIIPDGRFEIDSRGNIYVDQTPVASLEIRQVKNPDTLEQLGENYFRPTQDSIITDPEPNSYSIMQGALEGSNVDALTEMIRMIELQRSFELLQKNIQTNDQTLEKIINQAGRPR